MVASVQIRLRDIEVRRYLRGIPGAIDRAASRGLNKEAAQLRTLGNQEIRKHRNLKASVVRDATFIDKARPKDLTAKVVVGRRGRPRSLRRYGAKVVGRRGRGNKAKGNAPVKVEVTPGRRRIVRGAFIRYSDNAVFRREGFARTPLKFLWGPSMWTAFEKDSTVQALQEHALRRGPQLIEHEMVREFKRYAGRHFAARVL